MKKSLIAMMALALLPLTGMAKELSLLGKPQDGAQVVTKVKSGDQLINIFTPKDSKWIKVADPRNGKVGWVKKSDLQYDDVNPSTNVKNNNGMYRKHYERKHRDQNGNVIGHESVDVYGTQPLNQQQMQRFMQRMRRDQVRMHRMMRQLRNRQFTDPFDDPFFDDPYFNAPQGGMPRANAQPQVQQQQQGRPDRITVPSDQNKSQQHIR